jgi:hypothetical protein
MQNSKNISGLAWGLILIFFVVGLVIGGYFWPRLGTKNPFETVPVFADQQLNVPNTQILSLDNNHIVIKDYNGTTASFPLAIDFQAVDINAQAGKDPKAPAASVSLSVGQSGTIVLKSVGVQYQAYRFYLVPTTQ